MFLRRFLTLGALLVFSAGPAWAQSGPVPKGMDVYRSQTVTLEQIKEKAGSLLSNYLAIRNDGRRNAVKRAQPIKVLIESRLRELAPLAYASMFYGEYYTSAEHSFYITFDLVDAKDANNRMNFKPAPRGTLPDPHGLLAAWGQYTEVGSALSRRGEISSEHPECLGFYCLWGSATPELAGFEQRFSREIGGNKKPLLAVLKRDSNPQKRVAALYLLSYLPDGREVAAILLKTLQEDSDETVRGAALQVLSDISVYHKTVPLDAKKIVAALDYPSSSERSKALALLVGMCENPDYRPYILKAATPTLLNLLKLNQPSNHDLAFTLLGLLSREAYGPRDYEAWEKWASAQK